MAGGEEGIDAFPGLLDLRIRRVEDLEVVHVHGEPDPGALRHVQLGELVRIGQEGDAVGMADQELDVLRSEVRKDRDHDRLIGVDGKVRHSPACAVPGPEGDVGTLPQTGLIEEDVELLDEDSHLRICE